jgi:hypothetical protein
VSWRPRVWVVPAGTRAAAVAMALIAVSGARAQEVSPEPLQVEAPGLSLDGSLQDLPGGGWVLRLDHLAGEAAAVAAHLGRRMPWPGRLLPADARAVRGRDLVVRVEGGQEGEVAWRVELGELAWGAYRLSGAYGVDPQVPLPMHLRVHGPEGLRVVAMGRTQPWAAPGGAGQELVLRRLEVAWDRLDAARPLFPRGAARPERPLRLQVDRLRLQGWPELTGVVVQTLEGEGLRLALGGRWCQTALAGEARVAAEGRVEAVLEQRLRDVPLSGLVACALTVSGAKTPPVYVEGRTSGELTLFSAGDSLDGLWRGAGGDLALVVRQGRVMRLSQVRASWGFVLDLLSSVRLNPTRLRDTLPVDELVLRGVLEDGVLRLDPVDLRGPVLRARGRAEAHLHAPGLPLHLDLEVSGQGLSRNLKQDTRLAGGGDENDDRP